MQEGLAYIVFFQRVFAYVPVCPFHFCQVMASLQSRVLAMVENFKSKTLKLTEDGVTYAKTVKSKVADLSVKRRCPVPAVIYFVSVRMCI